MHSAREIYALLLKSHSTDEMWLEGDKLYGLTLACHESNLDEYLRSEHPTHAAYA